MCVTGTRFLTGVFTYRFVFPHCRTSCALLSCGSPVLGSAPTPDDDSWTAPGGSSRRTSIDCWNRFFNPPSHLQYESHSPAFSATALSLTSSIRTYREYSEKRHLPSPPCPLRSSLDTEHATHDTRIVNSPFCRRPLKAYNDPYCTVSLIGCSLVCLRPNDPTTGPVPAPPLESRVTLPTATSPRT